MQDTPRTPPQPKLRPAVFVIVGMAAVGAILIVWQFPLLLSLLPIPAFPTITVEEQAPPPIETLPAPFTMTRQTYGPPVAAPPKPDIPIAVGIPRSTPPVSDTPRPQTPEPTSTAAQAGIHGGADALPDFLKQQLGETAQGRTEETRKEPESTPAPHQPRGQQQGNAAKAEKEKDPKKNKWLYQVPTQGNLQAKQERKEGGKEGEKHDEGIAPGGIAKQNQAANLIKPATWARSGSPYKTLFRSQVLPGRLEDSIDSSIPGMARIRLTVPIFDRFGQGRTILEKDTIVIVSTGDAPAYGATRLPIKIDQLETPDGIVISLKAAVGDSEGKVGLSGDVNNHYGKLLAAVGLNALLNLGARGVVGTSSGFQPSVGQQVVGEFGESLSRDARGIVDKQLKVPPTITVPAGSIVSIQLGENIVFSRKPLVIK